MTPGRRSGAGRSTASPEPRNHWRPSCSPNRRSPRPARHHPVGARARPQVRSRLRQRQHRPHPRRPPGRVPAPVSVPPATPPLSSSRPVLPATPSWSWCSWRSWSWCWPWASFFCDDDVLPPLIPGAFIAPRRKAQTHEDPCAGLTEEGSGDGDGRPADRCRLDRRCHGHVSDRESAVGAHSQSARSRQPHVLQRRRPADHRRLHHHPAVRCVHPGVDRASCGRCQGHRARLYASQRPGPRGLERRGHQRLDHLPQRLRPRQPRHVVPPAGHGRCRGRIDRTVCVGLPEQRHVE